MPEAVVAVYRLPCAAKGKEGSSVQELILTARSLSGDETYRPLTEHGLTAAVRTLAGDGSARDPWVREITLENKGSEDWLGVIRIALPTGLEDPRFFLPGFMYGTNRGDAPLFTDSQTPRLRREEEFPAFRWWMTRSDRLSHPCAFVYGSGRLEGLCAAPYLVSSEGRRQGWMPGITGSFDQYTGFGCDLEGSEVSCTLGYENAPWFFLDSHKYSPRAPMGSNCFRLAAGESLTFTVYRFSLPAADERTLHDALRWVYSAFHQQPRRRSTIPETVNAMANAIARDAWLPEKSSYACFVFDRGDHFEYRELPSISWTNGLSTAAPMLMCAHRLGREDIRRQALCCIDHIVECSLNPASGLLFMCEKENGRWDNNGWWSHKQPVPGHAAYLVGQSCYLILRSYALEKQHGYDHPEWLGFVGNVLTVTQRSRNSDGEYPYVLSEKTGAGLCYDSFSGCWLLAAAAYHAWLTGDHAWLPDLLASERYYHAAFITRQECYGGPLDIDKQIDSEGILSYIRAVRYLHAVTGEDTLLDRMRDALHYEYTFKFCYNSPVQTPPLSKTGWCSCGGSITSVTNPHVHPMSSSVCDEMYYYLDRREDDYIRSRLRDTILWSCQCHNTRDRELDYGLTGWMSERYCHSEGLLTEHYPDGSPASTWFALMPWGCGSILEGIAGAAWERFGKE